MTNITKDYLTSPRRMALYHNFQKTYGWQLIFNNINEIKQNHEIITMDSNFNNIPAFYPLTEKTTKEIKDKFENLPKHLELIDLLNCNNLKNFQQALNNTKNNQYYAYRLKAPYKYSIHTIYNITKPYQQAQLNYCLENLNNNLPNYYKIIDFLIENGAYYTKNENNQIKKDVSKTNFIQRQTKNMLKIHNKLEQLEKY